MSDLYSGIAELNDHTLESTLSAADRPVLIDFWAEWCGPCQALGPVIEQLARDEGARVLVAKVNVDRSPVAARSFNVRSIPTVVLYRKGKAVETLVGLQPKSAYSNAISRALET
ncbi:MAG: thioredoxin [Gammaproteobacteria bacterium]